MGAEWFDRATARSDAGRLAAATDWAATPLGDPSTWPQGLRTAVELCFGTTFPVLVTWGPDLLMIYNDGYRDLLGPDKHPAMGRPTAAVWPEVWDDIEPLFAQVLTTGEPTWLVDQRLLVNRAGYEEEAYFTFAYSALRDDDGAIAGVLDISAETTEHVIDRRRLRCLAALAAQVQHAGDDVGAVARSAVAALEADRADIVSATIDLLGPDGHRERLATSDGGAHDPDRVLVVPLRGPGEPGRVGILELELSPHRPLDAAARDFAELIGSAIGAAISGVARRRREVAELRAVSEELQRSMLPVLPDAPDLAARYLPATDHLSIGGDWYDAVDIGGGRLALLVGDCVGHGLAAAAMMGNLRSASRALLLEEHGPAGTIEALDRFARTVPGSTCTTVLCAIVDGQAGTITWSSAGHPPALLLGGDGPAWLDDFVDVPLGVAADRKRREAVTPLGEDAVVVLYTDGLVERRREPIDAGLARLASVAGAVFDGSSVQRLADGILDVLAPERADDVALLVHAPGRS